VAQGHPASIVVRARRPSGPCNANATAILSPLRMATDSLHFANPPITEAIIAIVVRDLPDSASEQIRELVPRVVTEYPKNETISQTQFVGEIPLEAPPKSSVQQKFLGLQFRSEDSKQIFQARLNGFSFHRLAPYDRWETFRAEAFRLWEFFRETIGDVKPLAFSVRYINALVVPAPARMEEFLKLYPELPEEWPQMLSNYIMRLDIPIQDKSGDAGHLTAVQTLLPSQPRPALASQSGTASILLDLNLQYPALRNSNETLWQRIDAVRPVKNRLFDASLTEAMKERIS
jgi:uncharacterized protein (TIGR04255 family)